MNLHLLVAGAALALLASAGAQSVVEVRDFGAKGDGMTDDTAAVQHAIDAVKPGGVLQFAPGTYLITSVKLAPGVTYQGEDGAVVKRPPKQGKWTRTFYGYYSGEVDSAPLVIRNLTFDGNSTEQDPYTKYELEQAHLIFLVGDPKKPGRLNARVENCRFRNGVADGVSAYTNANVVVRNCEATDVFRGGFVLTGGNSSADVDGLITGGERHDTGIDIEIDGKGYGDTLKVDVKLKNLELRKGDFDVGVSGGSVVTGEHIKAGAPFYLYSHESTMRFKHCSFAIGGCDTYSNRIAVPFDVRFEDCEFTITRELPEHPPEFFAVADVFWNFSWLPTLKHQRLTYERCRFQVDQSITGADKAFVIHERREPAANGNVASLIDPQIGPGFTTQHFRVP